MTLLDINPLRVDGVSTELLYAPITASSSGNTAVVSGVSGKKIRVIAFTLVSNGTVNVKWQSNTTDLTGLSYFIANTGEVDGPNEYGWMQTAAGEDLNINLSGNVAVGGKMTYILVAT